MIITGHFSTVRQQLNTLIFSLSLSVSALRLSLVTSVANCLTACARCLVTLLTLQLWFTGSLCRLPCALLIATCLHTMQHKQKRTGIGNEFGVFYAKCSIFSAVFSCGVHGDLDVYSCLEWIVSGGLGLGRLGQGSNIKEMLMFCFELRLSQHHNSWALIIKKQWRVFKLYQKIYRIFYI